MLSNYEIGQDKYSEICYFSGNRSCPLHFHRKIEINYILKNPQKCTVENKEYTLDEGEVLFVDSFEMHSYERRAGENIVVIIPQKYMVSYERFMADKSLKCCVLKDKEFNKKILNLLKEFENHENMPEYRMQSVVDYLLSEIVLNLGYKHKDFLVDKRFAEQIISYLEEHFKEDISLKTISEHFGYSKYYFSRIFNNLFCSNMNEYISAIRLEHALYDIKTKGVSVTTAAYENGFNSMQSFYRINNKINGCAPLKLL